MTTMPTNTVAAAEIGVGIGMGMGMGLGVGMGVDLGAPQNGREARNLAEKHRRDKLNASIQELATMVPHAAESSRRLDKTAILRFAAHGLRLQYVFGKSVPKKRLCGGHHNELHDDELQQPQLTDALMQLLDSFFITLTCHGQIVVISASVEQLLGHCQSDLYGQNILHITHPEDQELLLQQLIPQNMESLFRHEYRLHGVGSASGTEDEDMPSHDGEERADGSGAGDDDDDVDDYYCQQQHQQARSNSPHSAAHLADIDRRLRADRRCFTVRLARAGTRSESARSYEIAKIDGCFRRSDCSASAGTFPIVSQLIRRSRNSGAPGVNGQNLLQHDAIAQAALHGISGNDIVLVAMARIIRPPKVLNRLLDAGQLEYRTRHLIDGRIIDCDQRIGLVAGYMKDEVRNLSPFSFMHQDDVRWVIVALRQMYDCNSDYGESCYRLITRNGHFIYLQTKGYLEIDKSTNKVHSFVCVNTLLNEEEGRRKVQEMKNKFSVIIKTKIPSNSLQDVPASQNPQQLERIVLYLIENLQKRHDNGAAAMGTGRTATATQADHIRYAKSPPLALVPPEPASVKNSISKSVSVVNVTAAKNLQHNLNNLRSPASMPSSDVSLSPASSLDTSDDASEQLASPVAVITQRPSVLQMKSLPARSSCLEQNSTLPQVALNATNGQSAAAESSPITSSSTIAATEMLQKQFSVLKRLCDTPLTAAAIESVSPAKRNSSQSDCASDEGESVEIGAAISSSLDNLDQSLHSIQEDARSLCQQHACLRSPVPRAINQKLDAIFVEHQKQTELLVNIKNEYNVHLQQRQLQHEQQPPQQEPQLELVAVSAQPALAHFSVDSAPLGQPAGRP